MAASLAGCGTTVVAPADPNDPVQVFVVDQGRTASLVIPANGGGLRRYAYGEWRWYALGKRNALRAFAVLFWPTQGALGRARLDIAPTLESLQEHLEGAYIDRIHAVTVERDRAEALESRIEALYAAQSETEVDAPGTGLAFVHHPRAYTAFHNSNHRIAAWLRELGCRTLGPSMFSRWRVAEQQPRD